MPISGIQAKKVVIDCRGHAMPGVPRGYPSSRTREVPGNRTSEAVALRGWGEGPGYRAWGARGPRDEPAVAGEDRLRAAARRHHPDIGCPGDPPSGGSQGMSPGLRGPSGLGEDLARLVTGPCLMAPPAWRPGTRSSQGPVARAPVIPLGGP